MNANQIIAEIQQYMAGSGAASWHDIYVGITADPRTRLFQGHRVNEKTDPWIFRAADSSDDARAIEQYFLQALGADGGPGGGDDTAVYVYAYLKTAVTVE